MGLCIIEKWFVTEFRSRLFINGHKISKVHFSPKAFLLLCEMLKREKIFICQCEIFLTFDVEFFCHLYGANSIKTDYRLVTIRTMDQPVCKSQVSFD